MGNRLFLKLPAKLHRLIRNGASAIAKRLYDIPVRTKMLAYAGILIALILGLAGATMYQFYVLQTRQLPARTAVREMVFSLMAMRVAELQFIQDANTLNTEFYIKHSSKSIDDWQQNYQNFESNYDNLVSLYTDTDLSMPLQLIKPQTTKYRDTFLALASTYQQRGFQVFGREGVLEERSRNLETTLATKPQHQALLLQLRHAQDTFLLRKDLNTVALFNDYASQLAARLSSAQDRVALEEYVNIFKEVVALDQKIGFTTNDGLRANLSDLAAAIVPQAQSVETSVLDATSERMRAIFSFITIITLTVTILAIILAFLLSRLITHRLGLLLRASQSIAKGDFSFRLPHPSKDELGQLSAAFNTMAGRLQEDRKMLHERALALQESVRRFELVSRAVDEAIYEWDIPAGKFTWGDGLQGVFGYKLKDKTTPVQWWTERIHPEDAQLIDGSLGDHLARHSSTWNMVYRFKKASGQYAYCRDQGFIEYKHGQPVRMVGSLINITHQKELDRAKDEFISIASHQLRTPLGSVRWNLELLMEKLRTIPRESAVYIEEAYKSTMRMLSLVGDLLSVARIEQNRVQDMPQLTDIVAVIGLAIDELRLVAKQRNITIDLHNLKDKKVQIVIDPKLFRESIQNLLSNAVKYTPPGGTVAIAVKSHAEEVIVSVADTGLGIPPEDQSNLFSKFFRAKNVTTTDTEGSGLGLFVVKSYVARWGGRIWFESKLNKGSTFYISIPVKQVSKNQKARI